MRCETDPFLCIITRACSASLDNERCSDRFVADYALDPILRFSRFKRFRPCPTDTVLLLRASRFRLGLASFGSMVHPTRLNSLLRISLDCSVTRSPTLLSDLRRSVDLQSNSQLWMKSFRRGGDLILLPVQLGLPRFLDKPHFLPPQFSLSLPSLISTETRCHFTTLLHVNKLGPLLLYVDWQQRPFKRRFQSRLAISASSSTRLVTANTSRIRRSPIRTSRYVSLVMVPCRFPALTFRRLSFIIATDWKETEKKEDRSTMRLL